MVVNGKETENHLNGDGNDYSRIIKSCFPAFLATPWPARVPLPFCIHAKENFGKKKV